MNVITDRFIKVDEVDSEGSELGPALPYHWKNLGWRYYLSMIAFLISMFVIATLITTWNLMILYRTNPGYGRNLLAEQAFCTELDAQFINSVYYWDEEQTMCRIVGAAARHEGDEAR